MKSPPEPDLARAWCAGFGRVPWLSRLACFAFGVGVWIVATDAGFWRLTGVCRDFAGVADLTGVAGCGRLLGALVGVAFGTAFGRVSAFIFFDLTSIMFIKFNRQILLIVNFEIFPAGTSKSTTDLNN